MAPAPADAGLKTAARRCLPAAALGVLLAMLAPAATAQSPGGGGHPGGGGRGGMGGMQGGRAGVGIVEAPVTVDAAEQLQIQLAELEEDLKLAPGQRPAWNAYANRVQLLAGDLSRSRNAMRFPRGTAAQQFDFLIDRLRDRVTAFEDIGDAGKALYATLTADQREIADRRLARVAISLVESAAAAGPAGGRHTRGPPPP